MDSVNNNYDNNTVSWLEKYRPQLLTDYYISKKQLDVVKTWIKDFRNSNDSAKPFLILHGTTGIGKTTLAYLILKYYDYEIIECNASDARTKKNIRESLGQISKTTVCVDSKNKFKQVAIIMDEIDGLAGGESGSVQELIDIVTKDKDSKKDVYICPVVCTTNSIKDKKLQPLIKQSVVLNINAPSSGDCIKLINKISKTEGFIVPNIIKNDIVEKAYGDYRQIIMLLFSYYHSLKIEIEHKQSKTQINISCDWTDIKHLDKTKKCVFISGVTGQDGSHMVDYLLEKTDYIIFGGVRRLSVYNHINLKNVKANNRFFVINFDLTDPHVISKLMEKLQPDYFINFAAQSFVASSWDFARQTWQTNSTAVLDILEAILLFKPSCRLYQAGSSEEFGNVSYIPQDEKHPMKPRSPYGASKVASRQLIKVYRDSYNLYAIQGWLFNHEGTRRGEEFVTRKISKNVVRIAKEMHNNFLNFFFNYK